jgi:hypothetical protein
MLSEIEKQILLEGFYQKADVAALEPYTGAATPCKAAVWHRELDARDKSIDTPVLADGMGKPFTHYVIVDVKPGATHNAITMNFDGENVRFEMRDEPAELGGILWQIKCQKQKLQQA